MATLSRRRFVATGSAAAGLAIVSRSRLTHAAGEQPWPTGALHAAQAESGSVIIGIGVNIASHPADTPYPATSLHRAGAAGATPAIVLQAFAERFERWHEAWRAAGFAPVRDRWLASARGLGEPIEVRLERETLQGLFSDLDETGALMLDLGKGRRRPVTTGDLFFPQL